MEYSYIEHNGNDYTTMTVNVQQQEDFNKVIKVIKSCHPKNEYHYKACDKLVFFFGLTHGFDSFFSSLHSIKNMKFQKYLTRRSDQ